MWPFNRKKPSQFFNDESKLDESKSKLDETIKNIDIEVANKKAEISNMILQSLSNDFEVYKDTFVEVYDSQEDYSSSRKRELKNYWTMNRSESSLSSKIKLEKKGDHDGIGISILFNYESGYSDGKWVLKDIKFSEMKDYKNFSYSIYSSNSEIYKSILYLYYKQFFLISKNRELVEVNNNYNKITNLIGKKSIRGLKLNSIIND